MSRFKVLIPDEHGQNLVREDVIGEEGTLILFGEKGRHRNYRHVLYKTQSVGGTCAAQSCGEEALLESFSEDFNPRIEGRWKKISKAMSDLYDGRGICFQTKAEAKEVHRALISRLKNEVNDAKIRLKSAVKDGHIVEVEDNS